MMSIAHDCSVQPPVKQNGMKAKDIISLRVCDYYKEHGPAYSQTAHTMAVASLTRQIALMQGLGQHEVDLLEMAAWLHDIGCPAAIDRYGNSRPAHQQAEGERIVKEWLAADDGYAGWDTVVSELAEEEKQWLSSVVGTHHQQKHAIELHFEPLFEADLIVNIKEGYYGRAQAEHLYNNMMLTDAGREMFRRFV